MPDGPRTNADILLAAAKALGRIDLLGIRGVTLLSADDIENMALALVILGLVSVPPHQKEPPARLVIPNRYKDL